jgi:hypothetical protein
MTKRIAVFIGLKIVEVGGGIAGLYAVLCAGEWFLLIAASDHPQQMCAFPSIHWFLHGLLGDCVIVMLAGVAFLLCVGIYHLIRANWKLAGKLTEKK